MLAFSFRHLASANVTCFKGQLHIFSSPFKKIAAFSLNQLKNVFCSTLKQDFFFTNMVVILEDSCLCHHILLWLNFLFLLYRRNVDLVSHLFPANTTTQSGFTVKMKDMKPFPPLHLTRSFHSVPMIHTTLCRLRSPPPPLF